MAYLRIGLLTAATWLCSTPALGGFFEDVFRGLEIYTTPSGSPLTGTGDGVANGNRFGRLRILPNEFGQGFRLEADRTFGLDRRGRSEVFDLGNLELQLSGATQTTLSFTSRGILTGDADIFANNLSYALRFKSGGQDLELAGQLDFNHQLEVNKLGFYSLILEVNNTDSSLTADGLLVEGARDADFDVGPITIQGNIFFDVALAVLTAAGTDTDSLEGIFPRSPINRINDDIQAFMDQQTLVLGETLAADLADGSLSSAGALEARQFLGEMIRVLDDSGAYGPPDGGVHIPEPASLLLVGLLGLVGFRHRT